MAVLSPTPSASVPTIASEQAGFRRTDRTASRASCRSRSIQPAIHTSRTSSLTLATLPNFRVAALRAITEALATNHENALAAEVADLAVILAQSTSGHRFAEVALLWSIEAVAASGQTDMSSV